MDYLLKASAVLIIFYVCYQLFLQRETFFQANRWFLLSGLIIATCIPFVVIPVYIEYSPIDTSGFVVTSNDISSIPAVIQEESIDFLQLFIGIYFIGILFFFGKLIIEFLSLRKVFKRSEYKSTGNLKILETNEAIAPFSFFNRIVYNPKQFKNEELNHVINHEKVHIKELHSLDTVIAQLSCLLFWFNPIIWLYKKALQQNLEFIADQKAQYISECERSYQTVLLKASVHNHQLAFTNNFYTSLIKKRIVMLHKSKSNKLNRMKFALVLPLLALFIMSFNTEKVYVEIPLDAQSIFESFDQDVKDIEIIITKDTSDEELKTMRTKLKEDGITFNYSAIKRNKKGEIISISTDFASENQSANYNINDENGIKPFKFKSSEGTFSVGTIDKDQNTFYFKSKDGKTKTQSTGSNVFVFETDKDEDHEGEMHSTKINVRRSNGNDSVYFVKPSKIAVWTSKDGTKTKINASENGNNKSIFISESDQPLFIIDGKIVEKSIFEDVDSDDIQSLNVLKGKLAAKSYGDKGKNGVIIMTKKGSKNLFIESDKIDDFEYEFNDKDGDQPLYILDGKVIPKGEMNNLNPNIIEKIEVIKGDKAIDAYGQEGKEGVIVIQTKNKIVLDNQNNRVVEIIETSPNNSQSTSTAWVYRTTDDHTTTELVISKNSTDEFLDQQKSILKKHGIDAKFSKVRRNKAGEITSIKISLNDNKGQKSSSSWRETDQTIPDIVMGKSGDKIFVRAIGN